MANPLSSRGWSDHDYAVAIGTLVGEATVKDGLEGFAAVADVIANRMNDIKSQDRFANKFGSSFASQALAKNARGQYEFSTWSPRVGDAYTNAVSAKNAARNASRSGFLAAIAPEKAIQVSPALAQSVSLAQQALDGVFNTGQLRGVAQGATYYDNPKVTAANKTGTFHDTLEDRFGSTMIGAHRFTGPTFTDQPFDPVTYNGMLAAPPAAETFLGDVGIPIGKVDLAGPVPDLTPAPEAGFSFADFDISSATLPADFSMDFSQYEAAPDFSDITANTAFDPRTSIDVPAPAAPNFSDVSLNTYPDITTGMYSSAPEAFSPVEAAPADLSDVPVGPQPSGFATGFGEVPGTPDFSAPSLEQRNADQLAQDRIKSFESALAPGFRQNDIGMLNDSLMAELAPQTPQTPSMAPAPVSTVTQAPQTLSTAPQGDFDEFGANFPGATPQAAPQAVTRAPQAPSASLPSAPTPMARTQEQVAKDYDLPSFDLPGFDMPSVPSVRDIGSTLGLMDKVDRGFMDAMANPDIARGWSPGFLDTGWGKGLTGAAVGFATGGPFGALTNGLFSGLGMGDMIGREFDRYANAYSNLSPMDFAAFMADGNPYDREPTRRDESGNATVGDGSYAESSGRNSNNPQGIL